MEPHKIASPVNSNQTFVIFFPYRCPEINSVCCVFLKMEISLITNTEISQISQMIATEVVALATEM